ncbi:endonuclease/exonuclease/phosphatase family protein [Dysgonomonas macrotermitis]|uniref:Endonuclease/Exonuclease/phosphatase family protein n=1 Tax=Dysgonomonas macrotermitis TaxID=1346286 RepID=A0A1M4Y389_9BACT|nr:endonuclease/exonuclease/phosphatase family protein [Dysgonomonas macrotermitis]SHF00158.1 Endonuclease/Exonuclease/phosphatase family protein [Dysgonomonas macrotermitis]
MKRLSLILLVTLFPALLFSQKKYNVYSAAFYNVENLFDTVDDEGVNDTEFTPTGSKAWTMDKYQKKLNNLAFVMSKLAKEHCPGGPAVIGVAEIENRGVLEDLLKTKEMSAMGYQIAHYDSPDRRGVDVALLYNPTLFNVTSSKAYPYNLPDNPGFKTRDQLLVSGTLAGDPFHVIVGHWPSRYGSKSSSLREFAASITKHIADSIYKADPAAKIVIMGDLNDDPVDKSVRVVLDAKRNKKDVKPGGLYNTMWGFYDKGIGSLVYQNKWNLFDQIIISESLLGDDRSTLKFWKAEIFNREFLIQKEGKNKGYPLRTFSGDTFINGYSDHFPTLIYLVKEAD